MKLLGSSVLMFVVLAFSACAPATEETVVEQPDTTEADIAAIREHVAQFDAAHAARDADALAALYDPLAVRMSHESPRWEGRDAIRAGFLQEFEEVNIVQLQNTVDDVVLLGDRAAARGSYAITTIPEGEDEPVGETGKWMSVLVRSPEGGWHTFWDIWNRDHPLSE